MTMDGWQKKRANTIRWVIVIGALVIAVQLFSIQVMNNDYNNQLEDSTVSRKITEPDRGLIFDRNGKLLVENQSNYQLYVNYSKVNPNMNNSEMCHILQISPEEFSERLEKDWNSIHYSKNKPCVFYSNLTRAQYNALQEHLHKYPGFEFREKQHRVFSVDHAANILGYLNEVDLDQMTEDEFYDLGDYIGNTGVEASYEKQLRGEKGHRYVVKNKYGKELMPFKEGIMDVSARRGQDLHLSIDIELQAFAEDLLEGRKGSIVAIDPKTGEILCMANGPSFDPNLLVVDQKRAGRYKELLNDPSKPLFDRSALAKYPPGSIFKTFVALTALELGVTEERRYIPCSGMYYYNGVPFKCHLHPKTYDIQTALAHSCNTYFRVLVRDIIDIVDFYQPKLGLDTLRNFAHQFAIGKKTGIDLIAESAGNVPTGEYYDRLYPRDQGGWKSPTVMSIGIGQGEIEMSNVQMANLAAILANQGSYFTPHLNRKLTVEKHTVNIDKEHFRIITEGMIDVIKYGTGTLAYIPDVEYCGKTGTSQNPHGDDHSVFFGYAPVSKPEIAVSVIIENAGAGSAIAAPISGLVVEHYLKDSISLDRQYLVDYIKKSVKR